MVCTPYFGDKAQVVLRQMWAALNAGHYAEKRICAQRKPGLLLPLGTLVCLPFSHSPGNHQIIYEMGHKSAHFYSLYRAPIT